MITISNLGLLDFLKAKFERAFRVDGLRWMLKVRSSITNWQNYYLVKFGLKRNAFLHFKTGTTIQVKHETFDKDISGVIDIEELGKYVSINPLADGYLISLGENGLQFFVKRPIETVVLLQTFVQKQYKSLKVEGKLVVDVGANIGDSALYFSKVGHAKLLGPRTESLTSLSYLFSRKVSSQTPAPKPTSTALF